MVNKNTVLKMLEQEYNGTRKCSLKKETSSHYLVLCESTEPAMVPSIIAVAVNKKSGKRGASVVSFDEAVKRAT